jgi:hypothetical protein
LSPVEPLHEQFIQGLPQEILDHHILPSDDPKWGQQRTFDDEAVEVIAVELQGFIAAVIASLIDAGSERDAINEDQALSAALANVLKEW